MTFGELVKQVHSLITDHVEPDIDALLKTLGELPEPEDNLESNIRLLLVDHAIKDYYNQSTQERK